MSGPYRVPQLPNMQTRTEQGVKFDLAAWYGVFAPAGTAPAIVERINKEINRQFENPESSEKIKKTLGLSELPIKTPARFAQTVRDDIRDWGAIVKTGNIKLD